MMSPRHAWSDFHSALPLPDAGPGFGEDVAFGDHPRAGGPRATAAVSSVEPSSITTISSTRPPDPASWARISATIAPTVAASSRAGRQTEIGEPCGKVRGAIGAIHGVWLWLEAPWAVGCYPRRARAHPERLRDRPFDAAATSPPMPRTGRARCQCLTDEQPRAVFRSRRSRARRDGTEETAMVASIRTPRAGSCAVGSAVVSTRPLRSTRASGASVRSKSRTTTTRSDRGRAARRSPPAR